MMGADIPHGGMNCQDVACWLVNWLITMWYVVDDNHSHWVMRVKMRMILSMKMRTILIVLGTWYPPRLRHGGAGKKWP